MALVLGSKWGGDEDGTMVVADSPDQLAVLPELLESPFIDESSEQKSLMPSSGAADIASHSYIVKELYYKEEKSTRTPYPLSRAKGTTLEQSLVTETLECLAGLLEDPGQKTLKQETEENNRLTAYQFALAAIQKFVQAKTAPPEVAQDHFLAVNLYTQGINNVYDPVNKALRKNEGVKAWKVFIHHLLHGLSGLPYYLGTVYRGVSTWDLAQKEWKKGRVVAWRSFSSFSRDEAAARRFATMGGAKGVLFVMESKTGRDISAWSQFPNEQEVLFQACCLFEIDRWETQGTLTVVYLNQVIEPNSNKVVLWVDDNPPNNKEIISELGRKGVDLIGKLDTEDALKFLENHQNLLSRDLNGFRVLTDLSRKEKGKWNYTAGLDLLRGLRSRKFHYSQPIMVYTSVDSRDKNEKAIQEAVDDLNLNFLKDNIKTAKLDAMNFACFGTPQELYMQDDDTPMAPSSPSSSASTPSTPVKPMSNSTDASEKPKQTKSPSSSASKSSLSPSSSPLSANSKKQSKKSPKK